MPWRTLSHPVMAFGLCTSGRWPEARVGLPQPSQAPLLRCSLSSQKSTPPTSPHGQSGEPTLRTPALSLSRRSFCLTLAGLAAFRPKQLLAVDGLVEKTPLKGFITPSGLRYFDFEVGTGSSPNWGDLVQIDYAVYTVAPTGDALITADSTFDDPERCLLLRHGNGEAVIGLEETLHSMRVGGRRRAIVPPALAYTDPGMLPVVPKYTPRKKFFEALNETGGTVVFDVELLKIIPIPDEQGYYSTPAPSPEEISQILDEAYEEGIAEGL